MSKNILLITDEVIKERSGLHGNIDPQLINPEIKLAQDRYIHPILGTALFRKLQDDIENDTLAGNYQTLMDDYIVDALIYYTMAELPNILSFQFYNKGMIRKRDENADTPTMTEIVMMSDNYRQKAEYYGNRLMLYLKENFTLFPEYLNPGNGVDTVLPGNRAFTMPIWLGDGYYSAKGLPIDYGDKRCCNE